MGTDLSELMKACEWIGIRTWRAIEIQGEPRNFMEFFTPEGPSQIWYGEEQSWPVTGLLVEAVKAKVAELVKPWEVVELDQPFGRVASWEVGTGFLNTATKNLTTTLAATALLEMYLAAEGKE